MLNIIVNGRLTNKFAGQPKNDEQLRIGGDFGDVLYDYLHDNDNGTVEVCNVTLHTTRDLSDYNDEELMDIMMDIITAQIDAVGLDNF